MPHWKNPHIADGIIFVDVDSLAEAVNAYIEERGGMGDGHGGRIPNFDIRAIWRQFGGKMDAYIFPLRRREEHFSYGVRHGDEPSDYYANQLPVKYHAKIRRV